jgi:OmpA-OmpF porin, OOP family
MKIQVSSIAILLLASGFTSAQASPLAEQGLRLLLGEPVVDTESESPAWRSENVPPASLSLHFSQPLGTLTNFFGNLSIASTSGHPIKGITESSITAIQGGIEWFLTQQQAMQWFLLGGMGSMHFSNGSNGNKPDSTHPMISLGVGQNWAINTNDALRWELRANQTFGNDNLPNWTPVNFQAIFSYQWGK